MMDMDSIPNLLPPRYMPVSTSEKDEDDLNKTSRKQYLSNWNPVTPWIFLTIFFASLSALLFLESKRISSSHGQYETGFETDFGPARSAIQLEHRRFKRTPVFDGNRKAHLTGDPRDPQLAGPPGPEIDKAWDSIISGRYFTVTEDEAREAWGATYLEHHYNPKRGGYTVGLDFLHTLHCVNVLRKNIDAEYYYPNKTRGNFRSYHIDHCLSMIIQSIMCHADLTPIPTRYFDGLGREFIDSDQVHTCRNFGKLRDWATSRYNGTLAVFKKGKGKGKGKNKGKGSGKDERNEE